MTFRQASFIEASITTLQGKLIGASIFVAVILFFFLGTLRPTIIALTAIPVSIFITALVFKYFGLSINTMTLGGLAIAIGGLVDDAVVGVENVLRRLKADRANHPRPPAAPDRGRRARHDGGALGHPVRHGHHRAGLHPAVRAAGAGGQAVRAAGHRLHRLDAGLADRVGDGDAGAELLPAAAHEEPGPRRHQGAGLAEGALPQQPAGRAGPAQGRHGGRRRGRAGGRGGRAVLPDDLPAALQRGHAADRPAAEPRRHA